MALRSCMHCGSPMLDEATACPQCGAVLNDTTREPPVLRRTHGSTAQKGWDAYEIPWFDLPLAFSIIRDPSQVHPQDAEATMKKFGGRALILSIVGLCLAITPLTFFMGVLPATLGIIWGLMVVKIGKATGTTAHRKAGTVAFWLGIVAVVGTVLTIVLAVGLTAA